MPGYFALDGLLDSESLISGWEVNPIHLPVLSQFQSDQSVEENHKKSYPINIIE